MRKAILAVATLALLSTLSVGAIVGAGASSVIGGAATGRPDGAVIGANAEPRYRSRERPIFLRN
jgi:hypothetical protein